MLDVDKLMQASPPGSMVYARVHDGDEWRTALVIRENRKHIRALAAPAPTETQQDTTAPTAPASPLDRLRRWIRGQG